MQEWWVNMNRNRGSAWSGMYKPGQASKNTLVKNGMKELKYANVFTTTDSKTQIKTKYYLPNTTLRHPNKTPKEAKADLLKVAKDNGAVIERLIALEFTDNWDALPGTSYSGE